MYQLKDSISTCTLQVLFERGEKMPSNKPRLMTYTTDETIKKFEYIANQENRSMSKELEYIIKLYIQEYEKNNGTINLTTE